MDKFKLCVRNSFQLIGAFEMYGTDSHIVNADNMLENRDSVYYLMTQSCYSDAKLLSILPLVDFGRECPSLLSLQEYYRYPPNIFY